MNWKRAQELAGLLLVLAGLLFVGVEIRQNNQLARGQARQALADQNQEWLQFLVEDSAAYADYTRAWSTEEELTDLEWRRARLMMIMTLRRAENVFLQHLEGLVDASALQAYGVQNIIARSGSRRFETFWVEEDMRSAFDPGFVQFVERGGL
jgi:hypothetical protein